MGFPGAQYKIQENNRQKVSFHQNPDLGFAT